MYLCCWAQVFSSCSVWASAAASLVAKHRLCGTWAQWLWLEGTRVQAQHLRGTGWYVSVWVHLIQSSLGFLDLDVCFLPQGSFQPLFLNFSCPFSSSGSL